MRSPLNNQISMTCLLTSRSLCPVRPDRNEPTVRRPSIQATFPEKQQAFLDFVLSQYVTEGVEELDQDKLSPLLILRYNAISDAILELGAPPEIRDMFVGFQQYLY